MSKNIILIGFMGTGKTEVGKEVAERLGYNFIDTDELIERKEGISIPEIFDKYGEPYFRKIESEIIEEVAKRNKVVIATGGGAVIKPDNRENLKRNGLMICLKASPEIIYSRTKNYNNRPLLKTDDPYRKIQDLLSEREQYYSQADFTVDTTDLGSSTVVEIILKELRRYNG